MSSIDHFQRRRQAASAPEEFIETTGRAPVAAEGAPSPMYITLVMTALVLCTGLAAESGRAWVVGAQLGKAVDSAALGAARMLASGDPEDEARRVVAADFPAGHFGTLDAPAVNFALLTDQMLGENIVTVSAAAVLPTTFLRLGNVREVTIRAAGEVRRRMVDLVLVLDGSSSIGSRWTAVRDASRAFVESFDATHDRVALVTYGNGANVAAGMRSGRGFDKGGVSAAIPDGLPGGGTAMAEGLYRAWDELRSVPIGQQSRLRVIVLFTSGPPNSVPGFYEVSPETAKGLRTYDFPKSAHDPHGQTSNNPTIAGLYDTQTGAAGPSYSLQVAHWNNANTLAQIPYLPLTSAHPHHRSAGILTSFPLQSAALTVNRAPQSTIRGLRQQDPVTGRYPAQAFNVSNAARNLLEIIADAARSDGDGAHRIRVYTIGMGGLVRYSLGTIPEKPEEILMRIANDRRSPDYNAGQLQGRYYFAAAGAEVRPAFQALHNELVRLTQ